MNFHHLLVLVPLVLAISPVDGAPIVFGINCLTPPHTTKPKPPCEVSGHELKFAVLGDWGGVSHRKGNENVNADVAKLLVSLADERGLHFVLNVGDNFYPYYSPTKTAQEQFKAVFYKDFPVGSVNLGFYSMLGNHDYVNLKGIQKQIEHTKNDERWILPERHYTLHFKLTESGKHIIFIVVDTQILCGNLKKDPRNGAWVPAGRAHMSPQQLAASIAQEKWMLTEIENAHNADHLLVVGHYQVHTIRTLNPPIECMKTVISDRLLAEARVTAYISGHEHLLQHWQIEKDGHKVHHVLSGEGYNIEDITKKDVATFKDRTVAGFFHGRVEDPAAPKQFSNTKKNAPGIVIAAVGKAATKFEYVDSATEVPLHSFSVPARSKEEGVHKPTNPREHFDAKPVDAGSCHKDWKSNSEGTKTSVFHHHVAGQIGCVQRAAKPSTKQKVVFQLGASVIKLDKAGESREVAKQIWFCFRCYHSKLHGARLALAYCHIGEKPEDHNGHLAYNRYVDLDGFATCFLTRAGEQLSKNPKICKNLPDEKSPVTEGRSGGFGLLAYRYLCHGNDIAVDNKHHPGMLEADLVYKQGHQPKVAKVKEVEGDWVEDTSEHLYMSEDIDYKAA